MENYHLRRKEKEITDQTALDTLLLEQRYLKFRRMGKFLES